jgi:hypothetical protein
MYKYVFLSLFLTAEAGAQLITFGVKGGIPLTETIKYRDESRPYVIGGTVELRLPSHFAVEVDALYQRVGSSTAFRGEGNLIGGYPSLLSFTNRVRGNSWEFPLLAKYYFRPHRAGWQPFVATGYSFRTIQIQADTTSIFSNTDLSQSTSKVRSNYSSGLDVGAVLGVGTFSGGPACGVAGDSLHAMGRFGK